MASLWRNGLRGAARLLEGLAADDATYKSDVSPDAAAGVRLPEMMESAPPAKSLQYDPFGVIEQVGFKDRPSSISYGTLQAIVWKSPVISAVVQARINQIAAFAVPCPDRFGVGYRFRHRDGKRALTKAETKLANQLGRMLNHTAMTDNVRGRDNFEAFIRKLAWDSLVYDQYCFEVIPDRRGLPCAFLAVDAASVRLADSMALQYNPQDDNATRYVQVFDGMVIEEYSKDEMCFGVRNPRSSMRLQGYGTSELEMMINAITGMLNGFDYNSRFFSQATTAKGILNVKGSVLNEDRLNKFKMQWYTMLRGVENAWQTPIINHENDLQYINMQTSNRDMEFSAWMDFLIKICCAFYMCDPAEVNFSYGNIGQSSVLSDKSNTDKLTESRERGLKPILRNMWGSINEFLIHPIAPDLICEPAGLDELNQTENVDLHTRRVQSYCTIDEMRAEDGMAPLPDGQGAIIENAAYLQYLQMLNQQKQMQAQMDAQAQMPPSEEMAPGDAPEGNEDASPEQAQETAQQNSDDAAEGSADAQEAAVEQATLQAELADKALKSLANHRIHLDVTL